MDRRERSKTPLRLMPSTGCTATGVNRRGAREDCADKSSVSVARSQSGDTGGGGPSMVDPAPGGSRPAGVTIGIPREIVADERRVSLIPEAVGRLVKRGNPVLVQSGA